MKTTSVINSTKTFAILLLSVFFIISVQALAQDEEKEKKPEKPARKAFESAWWFDGQTGLVYKEKTLEFVINHRFGLVNQKNKDLFGIYGASNIRLGFLYAPIKNLNVGFGYTKNKKILDFYGKYMLLTQTRSNSMPVSLTYHANMGIEFQENENYLKTGDGVNYFHQLIFMRRFGKKFSAQVAPSFSHFNAVVNELQVDGSDSTWVSQKNDTWAISVGMRYKITPTVILMLGYDQPITQHPVNQPKGSINVGVNIVTSSHAFQIFFTNYDRIQPQDNFMFNQNDFSKGEFVIGFNMTRLWSF
ncbi:MAG: DUF5777 family beta-barrel protein [Bacteroidota bacterium]